jgi:hypothetical protein
LLRFFGGDRMFGGALGAIAFIPFKFEVGLFQEPEEEPFDEFELCHSISYSIVYTTIFKCARRADSLSVEIVTLTIESLDLVARLRK